MAYLQRMMAVLVVAVSVALAACSPGANGENGPTSRSGRLLITGSSTMAPLVGEIAKRFEQTHPGIRVDVQMGGSSKGIADARQGLAHIGMASRDLKEGESDLFATPIAVDGICPIVHRDNPLSMLTAQQIVDVFTGKITNWRELGGADAPITVVNKAAGRSTLELFLEHFGLKPEEIKASIVIGANEQGIKTVAGNPDAIGYVSIGAASYSAASGTPIELLPLDGIDATVENVAAGRFPLSRPLMLVTSEAPRGLAKSFIDYARSGAVRDLVGAMHFVPPEG